MTEIVSSNAHEVQARLAAIEERMLAPQPALAFLFREMEEHERALFESFGGKYVKTGALEASLTGAGTGAIRELVPGGARFGTDIPYARFQGTEGEADRSGPSAVLTMPEEQRVKAGATVLEYIVGGGAL